MRSVNAVYFIIVVVAASFFISCEKDTRGIYTGDENAVSDSEETNDSDGYLERPDSDNRPGGGGDGTGSDVDNYLNDEESQDGPEQDSVVEPDDETQNGIYSSEPDVGKCIGGEISSYEKEKVLERVNYIRSLHNLPPVLYKEDDDIYTEQCALVIAANEELSHTPGKDWTCYSEDAYTGCNKSNIFIQWGNDNLSFKSTAVIDAFMTDEGVDTLGHRRWILDPWLAHISFGRADDYSSKITGAALKVINTEQQDISGSSIDFVAYPYEYYPAGLYNENVMMSFSVISDRMSKWNNSKVDMLTSAVSILDPDNKLLKITGKVFDNDGYGVPNNLRWFAESIEPGVRYNVSITGVIVNGIPKTYNYWFELK